MKKLLIVFFLLVLNFTLKAQYPVTQFLGSDSTVIYIKGAARTVGGFINGVYTDTAAANQTRIRQYQAAQIFTTNDSAVWFRMPGATKWVRFMPATPPSPNVDTSYWSLSGNYVADRVATPRLGTTSYHELNFITNDTVRATISAEGITRVSGNQYKFLVIDTTSGSNRYLGYTDGGSGVYTAGNGLTLSGSQFKLGGTLSENTTLYNSGYQYNWNSGLRVLNDTNLHISWRHNQIISNSNNPMALGKWHTKVRWVDKADSSHYYIGVNVSEIQHYTTSLRSNNIISSFDYLGAANYSKITFENDTASVLNTINISGGISNPISTFWARLDLSPESSNQNKNINGWTAGYINQLAMEGTTGTMTGHIDFYAGKTRRSSTYTTTNRIGYYVSDMAGYGHTNRYAIWTAGSGDSVRFDGPVRFPNLPSGKQAKQLYIDGSGTVYQGDSTGTGGGGVYTAGNGLTLSGSQFKLGGSMSDPQTEIQIPDGTELIFQIGAAGRFFINDDGSGDTILYARGNDLRLPIIPSGSSTDSVLVWTAGTGQVKKRNVSSLVSTPTLQEVLTAGSTLTTTNEIYGNANSLLFDNFSSISFTANNVNLNGISSVLSVSDSILLQPNQSILNIDSLRSATIADTLYKKPMTWDTRNGRWEYLTQWPSRIDTITIASFGYGARLAGDTAAATDSSIYGAFYHDGSDTLIITGLRAVITNGDTLGVQVYYNDTINVIGSAVATSTLAVNSSTTGNSTTTFSNNKIPPGNWVWCKSPTVVAGRKPEYLSVSLIGYRKTRQ